MLLFAIGIYLIGTISLGLYASKRVAGAKDFMVAGRSLPLYMNFTCVFATWFGAETLLSVSATFARDGLEGVSGDPFGAGFCLAIVGVLFARAFYKMNLLTIGDFYRERYGRPVEVCTSLAIAISYLGWTSAQMTALGLVMYVLADGSISLNQAIVIGAIAVSLYTLFGGMWSVALTDLMQTGAIIVGLLFVAYFLAEQADGVANVIAQARSAGKLRVFPAGGYVKWIPFVSAFVTFALGSIPQQDVFQRVTSARDAKTAVRGTLLGGACYFVFAFVPMFIAYAAIVIDPSYIALFASEDTREIQSILPDLILRKTPVWTQVLFFGALLSAILSTASGTLLAPSSLFAENVIRPFVREVDDRELLWIARIVLVVFAVAATSFAVNSTSTMYEMVQSAYKVTLVGAFVPLASGVFWKRSSTGGAVVSIGCGLLVWLLCEHYVYGQGNSFWSVVEPQLYGLLAAVIGMILGSTLLSGKRICLRGAQ